MATQAPECLGMSKENTMLTLTAKLTTQAGKEWEIEAKMRLVVPKVRAESGNYAYSMHRSQDNP